MFKVKLSKLAELTDTYYYGGSCYELKVSEEDGEKYIEVNTKEDLFADRIEELKELIKLDKENFQNSVNKYIVTFDDTDGVMVDSYLKRLRYHNSALNIIMGDKYGL